MKIHTTRYAVRRGISRAAISMFALAIAGCGGGESGGGNGGTTANTAPSFTSANQVSIAENATTIAYQATASDAQRDTIIYSISGGADASAFTISSAGALNFVSPPNYDLPTDVDGDNVYQVTLQASDGKLSTTLGVSVTVTNDREGISVTRIATGLVDPVGIVGLGNGADIAIALKANTILRIDGKTGSSSQLHVLMDSVGRPFPGLTMLGLARARGNGSQQALYVLTQVSNQASVYCIGCLTTPISGNLVDTSDGANLAIGTGPDGAAYIAIGDPDGTRAQALGFYNKYGKIYRYILDPDPYSGASVPIDLFQKDLVGVGLREPVGVTTFPGARLAVSDRGGSTFDELSLTAALKDLNFGWPFFEGTLEKNAGGAGLAGLVKPSLVVPLGSEKRQSRGIIGGLAYTGYISGIANHYVFADKDGHIWSIPLSKFDNGGTPAAAALEIRNEDFKPDAGTIDHPVGMAVDANGALYILDSDGELFRVS
ncbi:MULTISPECIES: hypothetical protein [unclassified Novosphingobium]|uniref:hypothetical protein n=1 Tax=unclassified Novosphingobium TaxID=2644732 RepID=UPI00135BD464|nr:MULTISPECIES: hypothetical protein [unclassified Novosphingobium]